MMHAVDSFPGIIDKLFDGFAINLPVPVVCKGDLGEVNQVISVYGQKTPGAYLKKLLRLATLFPERLSRVTVEIRAADAAEFYRQLDRRFRLLGRTLTGGNDRCNNQELPERVAWSTKYLFITCNGKEIEDPVLAAGIAARTRRYALIHYLVMKRIHEMTRRMIPVFVPDSVPAMVHKHVKSAPAEKYRLNITVALLGALLRTICDMKIMQETVVSKLCRDMAVMFSTPRREHISAHSLRNAFDKPRPETLEQVVEMLKAIIPSLENFIEKLKE